MTAEFELPGVYVDDVVFDDLGDAGANPFLVLANRNPEPDEDSVRADRNLTLDIVAETGATISLDEIAIDVDAAGFVVAHDGVGFQAGWNGTDSAVTAPDAQTTRVVIDPSSDFGSLQSVSVRVKASTAALSIEETYSFTIEDLTSPIVDAATARAKDQVQVTFNEPVKMDASASGALNPDNYAFTRNPTAEAPSVDVEAVSVEKSDNSTVLVSLDIEMTRGAPYDVTVTSVEDDAGNVISAPTNTASFTGYRPNTPEGRSFQLWRIGVSQKNRERDTSKELRAFVECVQEITDLLLCQIDAWTDILDPDFAPEPFVDVMLCDLGNPFTQFDLSLNDKRKLVRVLVDAYRQKGTAVGIINLVSFFLDIAITIEAFHAGGWSLGESELGGDAILGPSSIFNAYSFQITSPVALTQEQRDRITDIARFMKPAHTHFVQFVEPSIPTTPDHLELGLSSLGAEWILH